MCFCFCPESEHLIVAHKNRLVSVVKLKADEHVQTVNVLNNDPEGNIFQIHSSNLKIYNNAEKDRRHGGALNLI